jgi:hypothetical protein
MASSTSMFQSISVRIGALVRRGAARRHQRGADAHGGRALLLQPLQRGQQRLERPGQQWLPGLVFLMLLKGAQTVRLVHPLGLVAEQHRVAVKRDAHLVR